MCDKEGRCALGPILYLLYTNDVPEIEDVTVINFTNDTALLVVGKNTDISTNKLQRADGIIYNWSKAGRSI